MNTEGSASAALGGLCENMARAGPPTERWGFRHPVEAGLSTEWE